MALYKVMLDVISTEIYHVEADSPEEAERLIDDENFVQATDGMTQDISVEKMDHDPFEE